MKKIFKKVMDRPSRLIEWAQYWLLALALAVTLRHLGGAVYFGLPMIVAMHAILPLAAVHALSWVVRRDKKVFHWAALLPLPFLIYGGISVYGIGPNPWRGELQWMVWVNAVVIYWVGLHMIKSQKDVFYLLGIVCGVVILAVGGAFFQYYFFPEWFPVYDRMRFERYLTRAAGFFGVPNNFAGFILLVWPFLVMGAWVKRFAGPVRIFLGLLAVACLVGIVISASRGGFLGLCFQLILLPFFLKAKWKERIRWWAGMAISGVVVGFFLWATGSNLLARLQQALEQGGESTRPLMFAGAWQMFLDAPIFGHGLWSFVHLWDQFKPIGAEIAPRYVHNDYLEFLLSFGIVGCLLVVIPLFLIFKKARQVYVTTPFYQLTKEGQGQMERAKRGQSRKHSSDFEEQNFAGRMPSNRLILGSLFVGFAGFAAHLLVDFHLQIPVIVFSCAVLLAVVAYIAPFPVVEWDRVPRFLRLVLICLPMGLAVFAYAKSAPKFEVEHSFYLAEERIKTLKGDLDQIFDKPHRLFEAEDLLKQVIRVNPHNGSAYQQLAQAHLMRRYTEYETLEAVGARAEPVARKAMELAPNHWLSQFSLMQSLNYQRKGDAEVRSLAEAITKSAPHSPVGFVAIAAIELDLNPRSEAGLIALKRALELDPDFPMAIELGEMFLDQ